MFVDSNVFILAYISKDRKGSQCRSFIKRIISGEQSAVTSPLVFDEVAYALIECRGLEFAKKAWKNMADMAHLRIVAIDEKVLLYVPRYLELGLEPRDAFHAAAMYANGITTICTYDRHFDKVQGMKMQEPK